MQVRVRGRERRDKWTRGGMVGAQHAPRRARTRAGRPCLGLLACCPAGPASSEQRLLPGRREGAESRIAPVRRQASPGGQRRGRCTFGKSRKERKQAGTSQLCGRGSEKRPGCAGEEISCEGEGSWTLISPRDTDERCTWSRSSCLPLAG